MKNVGILVAPGFEEGETLIITDILRRATINCDLIGLNIEVTGGHDITIKCDKEITHLDIDYDMIILPGGYDGAMNLKNSSEVSTLLKKVNESGNYIAAMCAAPIVLEKENLLVGKKFTAYKGYESKISQGDFLEDIIVIDGNIITGRGPATSYAFAFALVDILGVDSFPLKERMLYFNAFTEMEGFSNV